MKVSSKRNIFPFSPTQYFSSIDLGASPGSASNLGLYVGGLLNCPEAAAVVGYFSPEQLPMLGFQTMGAYTINCVTGSGTVKFWIETQNWNWNFLLDPAIIKDQHLSCVERLI